MAVELKNVPPNSSGEAFGTVKTQSQIQGLIFKMKWLHGAPSLKQSGEKVKTTFPRRAR